jgi:hypothetical protein
MDESERREPGLVPWQSKAPTRAVGVASADKAPFVPDESQMAEGIRAAQRVDEATAELNQRGG